MTEPLLTGPTRNPWNVARTPGGSSGGSAAAVAAGVVPLAHASDGGGSIRVPASICGLVGLKPSRGRVNHNKDKAPVSISVDGCVSRSVRDTAQWLYATQSLEKDAPYPPMALVTGPSKKRLKIGLAITDLRGDEPDPVIRTQIEAAAKLCESLGHIVEPYKVTIDGAVFEDAFVLYWAAMALQVREAVAGMAKDQKIDTLLEPLTLQLAEHAASKGEKAIGAAVQYLAAFSATYEAMFEQRDLILTPVLAKTTPETGYLSPTLPFDTGFERVRRMVRYTPQVNASGGCAMSLPLGQDQDGMPVGAHFMAAKGKEEMLLGLAFELEAAKPWGQRRPVVWAG